MAVDAGTIYSEVRVQVDKLTGDIKQVEARLNQFATKNKQQSTKVKKSWTQSFKQINLAGVVAFAAIGLAVKQAIDIFSKYEQSMANVQSVTDATAEDFKLLEEAAIEAGESTRFTATQAADALYFLASAGLDATQSIDALQGVLMLAGATGSDLAFTSATMVATLAQFSLEVEESTRVSNVFAAAIAGSQATMQKLAAAMKTVGPISGAFGISLEETTANLEALFEAGLTGEESGTALRNIMLGLTQESGPLIAKLKALGIAFEDVNPQEVGLTNAIQTLAASGIDLAQVFERRTVAAILSLAETGGDALRQLEADITDTNAAAEMYAIQNDTLAGSMDFLKSAMESMAIKMVEEMTPALRGIVDTITDAVKWFNSLPGPIKLALGVFTVGVPVVAGLTIAIQTLGAALAGIGGPITIAVGAIAAVVGVVAGINSAMEKYENRFSDAAEATEKQREEVDELLEEYDRLQEESETSVEAQEKLEKVIRSLSIILPEAAVEFDEYGAAIGIVRDIANEASKEMLQTNIDLLESDLELSKSQLENLNERVKISEELIAFHREEIALIKEETGIEFDANYIDFQRNLSGLYEDQKKAKKELLVIVDKLEALRIEADPVLKMQEEERLAAIEKEKQDLIDLAEEQERLAKEEERRAQEKLDRQEEIAELTEELRRDELTEQERAEEDLLAKHTERLEAGLDSEEWYQRELAAIREKYAEDGDTGEKGQADDTENLTRVKESYRRKLEDIGKTQLELLELDKQAAIESIKESDATVEAKDKAIKAVKEYYAELKDNTANEIFKQQLTGIKDFAVSIFDQMFSALSAIYTAITQARLDELDRQLQAELEAAGLAEETELERLQRQLETAIETGDKETEDKLRQEIARTEILLEYEKKKAQIEYEGELRSWKIQLLSARSQAFQASLNAYSSAAAIPLIGFILAPIAAAAAAIFGGVKVAAVRKSKPQPPQLATGGIVIPGGTGGTDITVAENNAPELMLNGGAEGEAFLNGFAQKIADIVNTNSGGKMLQLQLYMDGKKVAESSANYYNNGIVRVKL